MPANPAPEREETVDDSLSWGARGSLQDRVQDWLTWAGLGGINPFACLDAGDDPDLSRYLIRHNVFRTIWQDTPSVILAPAGGGKSAFRVRLAYACRVEEDERQVFSIPYLAPSPTATSLEAHLQAILRDAAQELLLRLVYRPVRFQGLDDGRKRQVRRVLDQNAPGLLRHFLPQVERAGSLMPLVETFDPSASRLPDPPTPYQVRALCAALERISPVREVPGVSQRYQNLLDLLLGPLAFQAVYLLVDGVDAFPETLRQPKHAVKVLTPLLERLTDWPEQSVFPKFFLPIELQPVLAPLTKAAKTAIITWELKQLAEILRARLRAASRGEFDSLDAISAPSLRAAETELLQTVVPPVPRELLVLVNRVIVEHVRRSGPNGGLGPEDVKAAIGWYRRSRPAASSP